MSNGSTVNAELVFRLRDATAPGAQSVARSAEQTAQKSASAIERAAQRSAEAAERNEARSRSAHERTAQARERLGVRSEHAIQREIQATEAAYNRLARTGFSSAEAQTQAYERTRQKITQLTNEMGRLTAAQRRAADEAAAIERGQKVLRYGAAGAAGVTAGAYTLVDPARRAMSYDQRLAAMANTAYAARDVAGRIGGMATLEHGINAARRFGGGTREAAAEALDTMIASGTVSEEDALKMLPGIMRSSTASGATAKELATIAIRAKTNFRISADDLPRILSAALAAGQAGGFELIDMAKWLPQQMAMAGNLGLSGPAGFAKLSAWNQASALTSGTKDEAGNNLRDLLNELNTPHFRRFIAEQYLGNGGHFAKGEKEARLKDIDQVYLSYQERGVDKVSATIEIMQKVFAKDKTYTALQSKLRSAGDDAGRREVLAAMAAQVQGTDIGKVFHNQQSLMAFLGLMNNQEYVDSVLGKVREQYAVPENRSQVSIGYAVNAATSGFKLEQAAEERKVAEKAAIDNLTPAIGKAADAFSDLAAKYPALAGATILATTSIGAFAASAGLATVVMGGKLPGGGAIEKYVAQLSGGAIATTAAKVGKIGGLAGIGAVAGGYAMDKGFGEDSAISRYGSRALNGAAVGATLGSVVPLIGTSAGAIGGGVLGLVLQGLVDLQHAQRDPVDVKAKLDIALAPGLVLMNQSMTTNGAGRVEMNTGNVFSGAPR